MSLFLDDRDNQLANSPVSDVDEGYKAIAEIVGYIYCFKYNGVFKNIVNMKCFMTYQGAYTSLIGKAFVLSTQVTGL
jgi:hypothetical protein